ncbi:amino acid adenylation domain-containing protein [Marilutibacter spongiae]|uniref:amino acid adenylation domain-containing protein n=1 Tax=Marilutibacter spongiae TaxID=2025720 RepID=UPI0031B63C7B
MAPLPVQYADYAAWQRERLQGEGLARELGYWRTQLADLPTVHGLPLDRPRPAQQSFEGAHLETRVDRDTLAALNALARARGATLFMVLQSAFAALLSRWGGGEDIVMGTPVAGRIHADVEPLIGFFVNMLVLRTPVSGTDTFLALLDRNKATLLSAYEHQEIPFESLVEALQPDRSLGHAPLFQVLFALRNQEPVSMALPGVRLTGMSDQWQPAKYDLELLATEDDDGLRCNWVHAADLFDAATVRRLAAAYGRLLACIAVRPESSVADLPLLDDVERSRILEEFNRTGVDFPSEALVHGLFEAQAERTPDAVALRHEGETLGYAALNARANALAHRLIDAGVKPDDRVGVCMERSIDMVVALLATLKSGGAYVPIDPSNPDERLGYVLRDCEPVAVLVHGEATARVRARLTGSTQLVEVDAFPARPGGVHDPDPATLGLDPGHLAYTIYTSGSTGRPKGAMNEHRAVVNRLAWAQRTFGVGPGDRVLQKTPFTFDVSAWEFFLPLVAGAELVIARPGGHQDPAYLVDVIERERVDIVHFVPSMLQAFLDHPAVSRCTGLRHVKCSGEALSATLAARFHERLPGVALHNLYGPTEAAIDVTYWRCEPGASRASVPIGRPIDNTRMYVLDAAREPVPVGVAGELYIGGANVGRGYLARPELTAERFSEDPFLPGGRVYRTGDLGRWLEDGSIEYLGRNDFQLKIRGLRIEAGEIEACIAACEGVRECVVTGVPDGVSTRLVAYVVPHDGVVLDASALRRSLSLRLAEFMVPSVFMFLDALPLSANGKLDRKALPSPEGAQSGLVRYAAPEGPVERLVAEAWAGVLGLERVGRDDHFFRAGGHSLLATRMIGDVARRTGREIALRAIFAHPELSAFAAHVEGLAGGSLSAIDRADRSRPLPLSHAQRRLWFIDRMDGGSPQYNIPVALRLEGTLDVEALQRALDTVVARHEVLRTTLVEYDDTPVQVVAAPCRVPLEVVDLRSRPAGRRERDLQATIEDEAGAAFDLSKDLMLRCRLVVLADETHALLLTVHHVAADGWSTRVLVEEVCEVYAATRAGREPALADLHVQYADYAAWQQGETGRARIAAQLEASRARLAALPTVHGLVLDHPRPARQSFAGGRVETRLDPERLAALKALAAARGCTLYMALQATFKAVLARWSGERDIVIGSPVAGRIHPDVSPLIGFFVNTLVLRTQVEPDAPFEAVMASVRASTLAAFEDELVSFDQLVETLQPQRTTAHAPVFQVLFNHQESDGLEARLDGLAMREIEREAVQAKYDLTLATIEDADGLALAWTYATSLFERSTIERMARAWHRLVDQAIESPATRLCDMHLHDADDAALLAAHEQGPEGRRHRDRMLPEAFRAQALRTPDAPAVRAGEVTLRYAQLAAAVDALVARLRARGIGAGDRVGVWVERSAELTVALLAIMQAGAAYVPLDRRQPAARLNAIVGDAGIGIVLHAGEGGPAGPDGPCDGVDWMPVTDTDPVPPANEKPRFVPTAGAAAGPGPDDSAYVLYTSGSTGTPKGVEIRHGGLLDYCAFALDNYHAPGLAGSLVVTSPAFDLTIPALFVPLLCGGCVEYMPPQGELDALARRLDAEEVDAFLLRMTPSHAQGLLDLMDAAPRASAHVFVIGGESFPVALARALARKFPQARLYNHYGPTEAVVGCSWFDVSAHLDTLRGSIPVGRPMENTCLRVMSVSGVEQPPGVPGELWIGGAGVAKGYLGDPALSAGKFVEATAAGGMRFYRSGDRVRWRDDGNLEYLGRLDDQCKLRGFRIELGEVAAALEACEGVRAAAVAILGEGMAARLVAYVVGPVEEAALRSAVDARLPTYMRPNAYVSMAQLPLGPNGKLDRRALPEPAMPGVEHVPAQTATEEALAGIWREVLGLEDVSVTASFFDLGGHSLVATRMVNAIRRGFEVDLSMRLLFDRPDIRSIAAAIDDQLLRKRNSQMAMERQEHVEMEW